MTTENQLPAPKALSESGALIIGGTAGIGFATAKALAEAGVPRIVIVGRNAERGKAAAKSLSDLGADVHFLAGSPLDPAEAASIAAEAERHLGAIDIMMCTTAADGVAPELFKDIPAHDISRILTEMATPAMHMASAVLPGMRSRKGGVIINVASDAAKTATPGEAMIGAAKAAIVMFTRALAMEAKREGIRVNALTPSLIAGTLTNQRMLQSPFAAKLFEKAGKMASLGVAEAEDLADLAVFLASPAAKRITGQAISANGGISAA